jgi:hypothetical protein
MSNNKQQTAVEWLEKQTRKPEWHSLKRGDIFEQAKEMEKEQIIDAFYNARKNKSDCQIWNCEGTQKAYETFEQYYNETFNK